MDGIDVVVFDWYATLGAPNDEDFWPRIPELIEGAGGVVDAGALREWESEHPALHEGQSVSEATYRQWQRDRLEHLFVRCGIGDPGRGELLDHVDDQHFALDHLATLVEADGVITEAEVAFIEELRSQFGLPNPVE